MNPMPIISARVPAGVTFFQPFTLRVAVVCPFLDVDFRLPRSMLFRFSSPLFHCCTTTDSLSKAGIPAFIYAFQNLLIMRGFLYLDGLTINLINQTKTIFTAICVYLLLGRRQSRMQCVALLMLFSASVLLALDRGASTGPAGAAKAPADYEAWLFGGVVPVFLASILSGLASALSQRSLQVRASCRIEIAANLGWRTRDTRSGVGMVMGIRDLSSCRANPIADVTCRRVSNSNSFLPLRMTGPRTEQLLVFHGAKRL